jgi:hypothetical protein
MAGFWNPTRFEGDPSTGVLTTGDAARDYAMAILTDGGVAETTSVTTIEENIADPVNRALAGAGAKLVERAVCHIEDVASVLMYTVPDRQYRVGLRPGAPSTTEICRLIDGSLLTVRASAARIGL